MPDDQDIIDKIGPIGTPANPYGAGSRGLGTNLRAIGMSPRQLGTNPRATRRAGKQKIRQSKEWVAGKVASGQRVRDR